MSPARSGSLPQRRMVRPRSGCIARPTHKVLTFLYLCLTKGTLRAAHQLRCTYLLSQTSHNAEWAVYVLLLGCVAQPLCHSVDKATEDHICLQRVLHGQRAYTLHAWSSLEPWSRSYTLQVLAPCRMYCGTIVCKSLPGRFRCYTKAQLPHCALTSNPKATP